MHPQVVIYMYLKYTWFQKRSSAPHQRARVVLFALCTGTYHVTTVAVSLACAVYNLIHVAYMYCFAVTVRAIHYILKVLETRNKP